MIYWIQRKSTKPTWECDSWHPFRRKIPLAILESFQSFGTFADEDGLLLIDSTFFIIREDYSSLYFSA